MDFPQVIALAVLGLLAGVLGGLSGVGGSVLMIPGMAVILAGRQPHLYQAAALIVNVVVAAPASLRHWVSRLVFRPVLRWLVPAATVGSVFGVTASNLPAFQGDKSRYLAQIFAAFLAYVIAYNLWRLIRYKRRLPAMTEADSRRISRWKLSLVGLGMGFVGGLLGVGGGALAVPAQQVFLKVPLKNAIANSALTMVFSAFVAAVYKNATLGMHAIAIGDSLVLAAVLAPTAFIGGYIGAWLTYRLPAVPVRVVFLLVMIAGAWRMWTYKPATRPPAVPRSSSVIQYPSR